MQHSPFVEEKESTEKFSLARERVRQIKDKAINKLRATNRCRQLKVYLG